MNSEVDDGTCSLTIRGIPASVRKALEVRAEARHISLDALVVEMLTCEARTPTTEDWLAESGSAGQSADPFLDDVFAAMRAAHEARIASSN